MGIRQTLPGQKTWNEIVEKITSCVYIYGDYLPLSTLSANQRRIDNVIYPGHNLQWNGNKPNWFPGVKESFYVNKGHTISHNMKQVVLFECATCNEFHTYSGMQIDHISGWQNMIRSSFTGGNITNLQARILYNNVFSLRATCSICNGSHPEDRDIAQNTRFGFTSYYSNKTGFILNSNN